MRNQSVVTVLRNGLRANGPLLRSTTVSTLTIMAETHLGHQTNHATVTDEPALGGARYNQTLTELGDTAGVQRNVLDRFGVRTT
ncbi:MAG: hypothetical protein C7B46_17470 [Sulfobacillus benefaciens]|uniref:Uncharacterized protein n=1 Tax=Sulfobacillus benefaciens TaxID=453960 RepID=A0A2T2X8I7_9FIRM|nr:MAG: hypothetical protein C7B46_17470 [Sulfobacillus benefaciens]